MLLKRSFMLMALVGVVAGILGGVFAKALEAADVVQLPPPPKPASSIYTAYNIWYEKPDAIWSVNYHVGTFIPAGTEIINLQSGTSRRRVPTLSFQVVGNPLTYTIHFQAEYHPGMTVQQFANRAFSGADFDTLTLGMTPQETKCIKQGVLEPGMRKNAVLIAYGYPPEHQTPTVERNQWYYWERRFDRVAYTFNDRGLLETWKYE